ncbi:MAG TPA: GNAT family N-acetyltransferase [Candidatus Dormibacteraeota bacterium]|nr:GNAT family N-acetyltransferase [Candidatus Dormibacteraeota bacterium]
MSHDQLIFDVLPIAEFDWARLRDIRLRCLADAPEAFGSTWAAESDRLDSEWRQRAVPTADKKMWAARRGEEWIGLVGAVREAEVRLQLVSMWVDPAYRRQGVARALIAAVVEWHRQREGSELFLWVTGDNSAARRCYEQNGFQLTGAGIPFSSDPTQERVEMRYVASGLG